MKPAQPTFSEKVAAYRKELHAALDNPKTSEAAKRKAQRALDTINAEVKLRNEQAAKLRNKA